MGLMVLMKVRETSLEDLQFCCSILSSLGDSDIGDDWGGGGYDIEVEWW